MHDIAENNNLHYIVDFFRHVPPWGDLRDNEAPGSPPFRGFMSLVLFVRKDAKCTALVFRYAAEA
jgi:hypothetical protein